MKSAAPVIHIVHILRPAIREGVRNLSPEQRLIVRDRMLRAELLVSELNGIASFGPAWQLIVEKIHELEFQQPASIALILGLILDTLSEMRDKVA